MDNGSSSPSSGWPHWLRQVEQYLAICPQFVLSGNIRDMHQVSTPDGELFCSTTESLWELLKHQGLQGLLIYDRIDGFSADSPTSVQRLQQSLGSKYLPSQFPGRAPMTDVIKVMQGLTINKDLRFGMVVDYASRLSSSHDDLSDQVHDLFSASLKLSSSAQSLRLPGSGCAVPYNPIIWLADTPNDLPGWLTLGNEQVKSLAIELPSREVRSKAARKLMKDLPGWAGMSDKQIGAAAERFVDLTEGVTLRGMMQIRSLARAQGVTPTNIGDAVRCYKVGVPDNPWRQLHLRQRLASGESLLAESIKGQTAAVQKTLDILKRSVMGLSGAQASTSGNKPKGILFFAGPTGVGKTELAKAVTRLLFGDEQAYVRFDMSEFSAEHSEARLIGAPPGYIGHDTGGELVNAVRRQPFCLILFDEIEKAHPRILDKFLQILEDGRLTDGRGRTVHFSESVLVFTSNLGMYVEDDDGGRKLNIQAGDSYASIVRSMKEAIADHFRFQLQRPELLNRIGDNIVVFDFIRRDVAEEIFAKMIGSIVCRVKEELGLELRLEPTARQLLLEKCVDDLADGGRGIGNRLETFLINPLARALFPRSDLPGGRVVVNKIIENNGEVRLELS